MIRCCPQRRNQVHSVGVQIAMRQHSTALLAAATSWMQRGLPLKTATTVMLAIKFATSISANHPAWEALLSFNDPSTSSQVIRGPSLSQSCLGRIRTYPTNSWVEVISPNSAHQNSAQVAMSRNNQPSCLVRP